MSEHEVYCTKILPLLEGIKEERMLSESIYVDLWRSLIDEKGIEPSKAEYMKVLGEWDEFIAQSNADYTFDVFVEDMERFAKEMGF